MSEGERGAGVRRLKYKFMSNKLKRPYFEADMRLSRKFPASSSPSPGTLACPGEMLPPASQGSGPQATRIRLQVDAEEPFT